MSKRLLILFLVPFLFLACDKKEEEGEESSKIHYYDPKVPGGTIASSGRKLAGKVMNLTADTSQLKKITLSWVVPPMYKTMDYKIHIYKKKSAGSFVLPDPSDPYGSAFLYERTNLTGETFVDQDYLDEQGNVSVQVEQNNTYTYWVYIEVQDEGASKWSDGVNITVTSKTPEDTFTFPNVAKFWENMTWSMGNPPSGMVGGPQDSINLQTIDPGPTSINSPTGGIATAYSGNLMYVADTRNNRVVIYTRGQAHSCDQFLQDGDEAMYYACTYQYAGMPFAPSNALGQNSATEKKSCVEHQTICGARTTQSTCESTSNFNSMCTWFTDSNLPNGGSCSAYERCLTAPSKVSVSGGKLFISDRGNNRIVVYNDLPVKGHLRDATGGGVFFTETDGSPNMVIGKKNLRDEQNYPIGRSSLNDPGNVVVKGDNLYIADSGNNRVVKILNFTDSNSFQCNDEQDWDNLPTDPGGGNGRCKFTGLLGQRDYYEKWSFKEGGGGLNPGDVGYDGISCNPQCTSPYVISTGPDGAIRDKLVDDRLGRYFRRPTHVLFTNDGKFLVSANEEISISSPLGTAQMRGRVLIWDEDPMSDLPSEDPNKCNAGWRSTIDPANNFSSSNFCQADSVIGQRDGFIFLEVVGAGGKYSNLSYGLDSIDGLSLRSRNTTDSGGNPVVVNSLFSVDSLNNMIYYWPDFVSSSTSMGNPPQARVVNPNGALNSQTGRYLPNLQGISDISVTENNLIYISDPGNNKVYEIRAYNYETGN